jgi:hypothetical protein
VPSGYWALGVNHSMPDAPSLLQRARWSRAADNRSCWQIAASAREPFTQQYQPTGRRAQVGHGRRAAGCCPLLPAAARCCPLLPAAARRCPLLPAAPYPQERCAAACTPPPPDGAALAWRHRARHLAVAGPHQPPCIRGCALLHARPARLPPLHIRAEVQDPGWPPVHRRDTPVGPLLCATHRTGGLFRNHYACPSARRWAWGAQQGGACRQCVVGGRGHRGEMCGG